MRRLSLGVVFCAVPLVLVGCKPEGSGPPPVKDGGVSNQTPSASLGGLDCDPMVPQECGYPFPSNVYTKVVNSTPAAGTTGLTVNFGGTTLPIINGANVAANQWNDSDGFSPGQAAMTYLPGATTTGFPGQTSIATSLTTSSPTLLVDTSTTPPSLVAQFSELDVTDSTATDQAILIHPAARLKDATRYIVALQNVVDSNGHAIAPSPTFQALRDGTAAPTINVNGTMMTDPSVAARQALYADIFAKLKAAGITTSNLQIAWDYTTASKQNNVGQLESMYTQALAALPADGPAFTITSSVDNPDSLTARRIRGLITVPLFLNDANATVDADPLNPDLSTGFIMQRDSDGNPVQNGTGQFEFIVNIPASATTSNTPFPILIQGHGLFSDRSEALDANNNTYDNLILLAQNQGYITVSLDLIGWREPGTPFTGWPADWVTYGDTNQENDQIKALGFVSNDAGQFRRMIDRGTQGMLNQLIAVKMMETSFAADSHVMIGPSGANVIDTAHAYYRGDSQGGILGITFMALTRDCLRGFLGESGMPYGMLVMRSTDFAQFLSALVGNYSSPNPSIAPANPAMNVQLVIGLMQMFWDRLDGDGFAPYITTNTINADTPSHNIFMVDSLADHQVTPLGTYNLARTVGALQVQPGLETIYGVSSMTGGFTGNAIQEFDWGIMPAPLTDMPPPGSTNDPHDWARLAGPIYLETDTFLKTGQAVNDCDSSSGVNSSSVPAEPTNCTFPNVEP